MSASFRGTHIRLVAFFMACAPCLAASGIQAGASSNADLERLSSGFSGKMGIAALHLETGRSIFLNADDKFPTASVIKLPIMVEVFRRVQAGTLSLDDVVTATAADRVPGSGILQDLSPGLSMKLLDAVTLMIVLSDNEATNLVIDRVGIDGVNATMETLGLKATRLFKKVFVPAPEPATAEAKKFGLGVTTPREMMTLLAKLAKRELVDPSSSDRMIEILKKQRDRDQIPRYLHRLDLGGKVEVANKTGALNAVRNDVAIVYTPKGTVVIAGFCSDSRDTEWTADNEATLALAGAAEIVVRSLLLQQSR